MILVALATAQELGPPGALAVGKGVTEERPWLPGLRFPLEPPAWANAASSGTEECAASNYAYPWRDTFCGPGEGRSALCPKGTGHTGQDLRPSTCARDEHEVFAVEAGTIAYVGPSALILVSPDGVLHRYLHLEPTSVRVEVGDTVEAGRPLGRVSNAGSEATHLHYDARMALVGPGLTFVPPYTSLVASYRHALDDQARPCAPVPPSGRVVDDAESCASRLGDPASWRTVAGRGEGGGFTWTSAWDGAASSRAGWSLRFETSGTWRLQASVDAAYGTSRAVPYVIRHAGMTDVRTVDQAAARGGWVDLGEYRFDDGEGQSVWLTDATGEADRAVTFDALRVSPVRGRSSGGTEATTATQTPALPPRSASGGGFRECGCDHAGGASPLGVLALLLARRRRT